MIEDHRVCRIHLPCRATKPLQTLRAGAWSKDADDVRQALQAGAPEHGPESAGPATPQMALRLVLAGKIYLPPFMAQLPLQPADPLHASGPICLPLEVLPPLSKGHTLWPPALPTSRPPARHAQRT